MPTWVQTKKRLLHKVGGSVKRARVGLWRLGHPEESRRIQEILERPVVIGGCGRSGTTLLLSVLSCHPRIFAIDFESMAFCPDSAAADPDYSLPFRLDWIWLHAIQRGVPESARRWCEKTPRNVRVFERILAHYGEGARVIHIVRDGRAVVASRHPTDPTRYHVAPERWVEEVSIGCGLADHPSLLTIRYEDLVESYQPTVRRLCEFIGEDWTPRFLSYPESASVRDHLAFQNGAGALSAKSLDRWKAPEHEGRVNELLAEPGARNLLQRFGYL